MSANDRPRYQFDRDARYRVTVREDSGRDHDYALEAYQGWLSTPDGFRHRFGADRRTRTELRDERIRAVIG